MKFAVNQFDGWGLARYGCLSFFLALLTLGVAAENRHSFSFRPPASFKIDGKKFDLLSEPGLERIAVRAAKLLEEQANSETRLSKKDRRGLRELLRLREKMRKEPAEREIIEREILEIAAAIANNHRSPLPRYVGLPDLPFRFFDSLSNPVAKGRTPAANLVPDDSASDISLLDPAQSTFWRRPASIASADLAIGFGRGALPEFESEIWTYAGPKTSGGNPGCELKSGGRRIKAKFAEVHSEPFASRIFHALGYHVDPTDYARGLKIRYDRRFFLEFNSRPAMTMKIGVLFVPIYTFHFEDIYDPFDFIEQAVFKDGSVRSGAELKNLLLRDPKKKNATQRSSNFREEIEAQIDWLVTDEANIQIESEATQSIGPWDFEGLGHEDLRELRGAGVLAAWLGWWDSRVENTRLRLVANGSDWELRHYFTDLGATLGHSGGTYRHSYEEPGAFKESFTRSYYSRRAKRWRIEFHHYEPIEDNRAFKEITFDDARWMARLIGQLTEQQIVSALMASGFDAEEVQVYAGKLISRRDQLIRDTRLIEEIPPIGGAR